jgi:hypothetical protein
MNKEQVYDTTIAPLMAQIIAACKENGIAMLATFSIPTDDDPGLCCTTMVPDETGESGPHHQHALRILKGVAAQTMVVTTENVDGSKRVTAVLT